jgi:hypothetical protein
MPMHSVKKKPYFVQPNLVLPEKHLFTYRGKLYQSLTISIPSPHQELQYTEFGTKEMSSSMNTSQMPTHSAFNFVSYASTTSRIASWRNGWELTQPLSNKMHEETQSSEDSNVF